MTVRLRSDPGRAVALLLLPVAFLAGACASPTDVHQQMLPYVKARDNRGALAVLEAARKEFGKKNAVLYHLERGMLNHYAGEFAASNESFEKAKRLAELHYTKSVTAEGSTFLVNDNLRPYYGENFERALIHVFGALNYDALGQPDEALVEVRQLNFFLRQLVVDDGQDNAYRDDAFGHYLAALFFEEDGDRDEAWVAYKKALDAYTTWAGLYATPPPPTLRRDARRLAAALGPWAEREYAERYGPEELVPAPPGTGRALVLHYNGRAPVKIDTFIDVAFIQGWPYVNKIDVEGEAERQVAQASQIATSILASDVVRVAFPSYREVPHRIDHVDVEVAGRAAPARAELVENVGAIAQRDLADRIVRIRAKAIARAVVKYALGKLAEKEAREAGGKDYGELAGALVSVSSALARTASEVADKRAWFTAPDQIAMCPLDLPEGDHELRLTYRDAGGSVVRSEKVDVHVEAGRHTFVIVRTVQ